MAREHWSPGTQILWTYGEWGADPMTVVADDDQRLVAWLPAGTPVRKPLRADGRPMRADKSDMFTAPRVVVQTTWQDHDVLRIHPINAWWSVWVFFVAGTDVFEGWYVNLEKPHTRTGLTTATEDLILDVEVEPDRSHHRKDEDELVLAVRQGRLNEDEADLITGLATQAEAVIDAWGSPFCDGWERWRPDPAWPVPGLPES